MAAAPIDAAFNSRAEQRRKKLLDIEREQQQEELEALKMTEEQFHLLKRSFTSVKFEFYDLDGQRWTQSALYTHQYRARTSWHAKPLAAMKEQPVVVSPKKDIQNYLVDETIRTPSRKPLPTIKVTNHDSLFTTTPVPSPLPTPTDTLTFQPKFLNRDCAKQRSPVKGLFQSVMRDLDMNASHNASWTPTDGQFDNAHSQLSCPPSPVCPPVGAFEDTSDYQRAQFAFTA